MARMTQSLMIVRLPEVRIFPTRHWFDVIHVLAWFLSAVHRIRTLRWLRTTYEVLDARDPDPHRREMPGRDCDDRESFRRAGNCRERCLLMRLRDAE